MNVTGHALSAATTPIYPVTKIPAYLQPCTHIQLQLTLKKKTHLLTVTLAWQQAANNQQAAAVSSQQPEAKQQAAMLMYYYRTVLPSHYIAIIL